MWSTHHRDQVFSYKTTEGKTAFIILRFWRDRKYGWIFKVEGSKYLTGRYYVA